MYRRSPGSFCLIGVELLNDINTDIILKDLKKNSDNKTANINVKNCRHRLNVENGKNSFIVF